MLRNLVNTNRLGIIVIIEGAAMRMFSTLLILLSAMVPALGSEQLDTSVGKVQITSVATGLDEPWAVAFLPDGRFLVTERGGALLLFVDGKRRKLANVPKVWSQGQGGLLDVVAATDFASSREIFLSYSEPRNGGAGTVLAVARIDNEEKALENVRVIFRMSQVSNSPLHFGSRIVEARDGTLYLTIGDRGQRHYAQDTMKHNGKVIRVNRDGSTPSDNPFSNETGLSEVYSLGHRNAQGAALGLNGKLWIVEHGAAGGDEINQPKPGKNYGWPIISYGREYSGGKIGEGTKKTGLEQPEHFWDPSIAPSGMMIYSGKLWPQWRANIFVGSLKFDMISRLKTNNGKLSEAERLFEGKYGRIRDIREGPGGAIWFLSVAEGVLYKILPVE